MKIVFISPWFSERMGYSENMFPKAMGKLGVEVHLVTSTAQIYYYLPKYDKIYKPFLGSRIVSDGIKSEDGFTLHRLPYYETRDIYRGPGIDGLYGYLEKINPDVIQTFEIFPVTTFIAAKYAKRKNCLLFTECHTHASIFRNGNKKSIKEKVKSLFNTFNPQLKLVNKTAKLCYPIAEDVAELAVDFYKVPKNKIKIQSLGVDTSLFFPPTSEAEVAVRSQMRGRFGFGASDIVCIYTGRFTRDKNPHCLAEAINELNIQGLPFKGLFIGNGPEDDIKFLKAKKGCEVGGFVQANELPAYYWAADIGVWPREESTSQLDAVACGLPIILSNKIKVIERVDGNGLLYEEGNFLDLVATLKKLVNREKRQEMSAIGSTKIIKKFAWSLIAKERLNDYESFKSSD